MNVPLLDLQAQYKSLKPQITKTIEAVLESQSFIMGEYVHSFEEEIGEYCETEHAFGCASGSDALLLALMASGVEAGDYVITSPFTFFATGGAIDRLGAIPVFIDIDPVSFNINPDLIRAFLEGKSTLAKRLNPDAERIKAIIPVHLYGQMADMQQISAIANEYELTIIEDAAQSIGAECKGVKAGNFGEFGCFSFFPSKNLGAYGDAGLITVKHADVAEKVDVLRLHGAKPKYHHHIVGINSRLDAIQAAILSVKLQYLDEWSNRRREIALRYNAKFKEAGLVANHLPECMNTCAKAGAANCTFPNQKLIIPKETIGSPEEEGRHIYHQYTIRVQQRDELAEELRNAGIGSSVYYPVPLHMQDCFRHLNYIPDDCPAAVCASKQAISLPIYPELEESQIDYVVDTIAKVLKKHD
jgi:dTDP-4-amino-4,6-dideoxygalactose transaminase